MKNHYRRIAPFLAPLFASALLSSCIVPVTSDDGHYASTGGGHMVYTTLPTNYVGSAYFYNGRYYSGGRYQTGRYYDRGHSYSSRYYYNGQYYYGGNYQQHAARGPRQDQNRTSHRGSNDPRQSSSRYSSMPPANIQRY